MAVFGEWAFNAFGQMGDGTFNEQTNTPEQIVSSNVIAIAAGDYHSFFIKSDGSLWCMGNNSQGQLGVGQENGGTNFPEQIVSSGVVAVAGGSRHSLFLKSDGSLWAMGENLYGKLGDGFGEDLVFTPEQIFPSPQPMLNTKISAGTNLQFTATCQFGGPFCLLATTNLAQPISQWAPVLTNSVTDRGSNNFNATLFNALGSGPSRQFYMLQSQ
jgi:alpha-tubulin suppressor-like RCC1 family protein